MSFIPPGGEEPLEFLNDPGGVVNGGLVPGTPTSIGGLKQLHAIADLDAGATLAQVIAKVNAILAEMRTQNTLASS